MVKSYSRGYGRVALDVGRGMLVTTSCLLNTAAAFSSVSLLPAATSAAGLALYHAHSVGDAIIYRRCLMLGPAQ